MMLAQSPSPCLFAVLVILVFACGLGCKKNSTEPSGAAGPGTVGQYEIAFVSNQNNTAQIHVMNRDGSNRTRLTTDTTVHHLYPEWSPDGRRIVYVYGRGDAIYVMNSDGTNQIRLSTNAGDDWDERPVWSPDGRKMVFTGSLGPGMAGIYVMNSDGTNQHVLASGVSPVWSRDGTKIAFLAGTPQHLFTMNADGTNPQQITHDPTSPRYPSWSPSGTKIAFTSDSAGTYSVYTINTDGTNRMRLTNNAGHHILAYWSSDGTKIVFGSSDRGSLTSGINVINADGTNQHRVADSAAFPCWSPDATKILFLSASVNYGLYVINPDGTNQQRLTSGYDWYPTWALAHP